MSNYTDAEEHKNRPVQGSPPNRQGLDRHGAASGEDERTQLCQAQVSRQDEVLV